MTRSPTRRPSSSGCSPDPGPADQPAQAGQHLLERERFGDVVVAAGGDAGDPVLDRVAGGQEQHAHRRVRLAQVAQHLQAGHVGQHDVEHDDLRVVLARQPDGALPSAALTASQPSRRSVRVRTSARSASSSTTSARMPVASRRGAGAGGGDDVVTAPACGPVPERGLSGRSELPLKPAARSGESADHQRRRPGAADGGDHVERVAGLGHVVGPEHPRAQPGADRRRGQGARTAARRPGARASRRRSPCSTATPAPASRWRPSRRGGG